MSYRDREALGAIAGVLAAIIVACGLLAVPPVLAMWERDDMFTGACIALDAKAEGDVCVKDGTVVMTREEFTAKRVESK